jgi:hypothetical protein
MSAGRNLIASAIAASAEARDLAAGFALDVEAHSRTEVAVKPAENIIGAYYAIWPDGTRTGFWINGGCTPKMASAFLDSIRLG